MDNHLLGIAKKAGFLEIGDESVSNAVRTKKVSLILSASDASAGSKRRAATYAELHGTPHIIVPFTKEELGAVIGRGMPGMIAVLDIGIAAAYVSKLALASPEQYDKAAETLNDTANRVRQRQKEALAHIRNKRSGKRRTTL